MGELNRLIDDLLHPLCGRSPELVIVNAVLHGLLQQNPPETVVKSCVTAAKDHQREQIMIMYAL